MHELLCSALAAANRITRILTKRLRPNENVCAALSKRLPSDYLRTRRRSDISGGNSIVRKDTVCHVGVITSKIRLRQKIKLEFIIHSIHKYVYMRKQIDTAETQAESSLLFRP